MANTAPEYPTMSNWIAVQLHRRIATLEEREREIEELKQTREEQLKERDREIRELKQALAKTFALAE